MVYFLSALYSTPAAGNRDERGINSIAGSAGHQTDYAARCNRIFGIKVHPEIVILKPKTRNKKRESAMLSRF